MKKKVYAAVLNFRYIILLFSLFGIILAPFIPIEGSMMMVQTSFIMALLFTVGVIRKNRFVNYIYRFSFFIIFIIQTVKLFADIPIGISILSPLLLSLQFLLVSFDLYTMLRRETLVNLNVIAGAFCGFIMLGIMSFFAFSLIYFFDRAAFDGIPQQAIGKSYNSLFYYSFVSLLTIGFGDILPISVMAQRLTIAVSLVGNFYVVFVMSVLVGRYRGSSSTPQR
ncbi:MAG: ion channel [Bacteroidales bacterium]